MNNPRDEWEGVKAEINLQAPTIVRGILHLQAPPAEHAIPCDFLDVIRGRSLTVAAFPDGQTTPVFHRRLRAWSEIHDAPQGGSDPFRWRVEVVTEEAWWRHRLLGARPDRVRSFPAAFVWVEEEGAEELPRPLP